MSQLAGANARSVFRHNTVKAELEYAGVAVDGKNGQSARAGEVARLRCAASAEGVHRKVGTGAEIFEQVRTAHRNSVLSATGGLHLVVPVSLPGRLSQHALDRRLGSLLAGRNLLLN